MNFLAKTTLSAGALLAVLVSTAHATVSFPNISVSPKSFISSCQQAGGTSSGGQGGITCQSGGTTTSCDVKDGKTENCIQVSRTPPRRSNTGSGGNHDTGNPGVDGGGSPDHASAGNDGTPGSASSGNSGGGNTIN